MCVDQKLKIKNLNHLRKLNGIGIGIGSEIEGPTVAEPAKEEPSDRV